MPAQNQETVEAEFDSPKSMNDEIVVKKMINERIEFYEGIKKGHVENTETKDISESKIRKPSFMLLINELDENKNCTNNQTAIQNTEKTMESLSYNCTNSSEIPKFKDIHPVKNEREILFDVEDRPSEIVKIREKLLEKIEDDDTYSLGDISVDSFKSVGDTTSESIMFYENITPVNQKLVIDDGLNGKDIKKTEAENSQFSEQIEQSVTRSDELFAQTRAIFEKKINSELPTLLVQDEISVETEKDLKPEGTINELKCKISEESYSDDSVTESFTTISSAIENEEQKKASCIKKFIKEVEANAYEAGIDNTKSCLPVESNTKPILPSTEQLLTNFTFFQYRPAFLGITENFNKVDCKIKSLNLYTRSCLLFSEKDIKSREFKFRAPGHILPSRPVLTVMHSIITENGLLHYVKVSTKNNEYSWHVLKKLSEKNVFAFDSMCSDQKLNRFINSDIVTTIYRRTNFLYYNNRIMIGKFLGNLLCLCQGETCVKTVKCDKIYKFDKDKINIEGIEISLSGEVERNEWFDSIVKASLNK